MNELFAEEIIEKRIKLRRKAASMETNVIIFLIELSNSEKEPIKTKKE